MSFRYRIVVRYDGPESLETSGGAERNLSAGYGLYRFTANRLRIKS